MPKDRLAQLKARARRLNKEYLAVTMLMHLSNPSRLARYHKNNEQFSRGETTGLEKFVATSAAKVADARSLLGIHPKHDLAKFTDECLSGPPGTMLYLDKFTIDLFCMKYEAVIPNWRRWKPHARLGINPGTVTEKPGDVSVHLDELNAFHDLAALHNMANTLRSRPLSTAGHMKLDALCGSALVAGFQLVEAYLNGLAYDFLLEPTHSVTEKQLQLLREKSGSGETSFVGFFNKLAKYPAIVKGSEHALLDENNCPEIAFLKGLPKEVRDTIVHASPAKRGAPIEPGKAMLIGNPDFSQVLEVSRCVTRLVLKIEKVVYGTSDGIWWLVEPQNDRFESKAFRLASSS